MSTRTDREIKDGLTEEDAAIFHSHGLNAYRAHRQDFDSTDYRAMLAREQSQYSPQTIVETELSEGLPYTKVLDYWFGPLSDTRVRP